MQLRHVVKTVAGSIAALSVAGAISVAGFSTFAGASGPADGTIVPGADAPVTPFDTGAPFSSGQSINVVIPANSDLSPTQNLNVVECTAPGGVIPTDPSACDGNTINGPTLKPNADGSVNFQTFTHSLYQVFALPDAVTLGENTGPVCNLTTECILYIGQNQNDFTQPHYWSTPFLIAPNGTDSGANPGDGSAPFAITTTSLPGGSLKSAYSATLAATSGKAPYTWSITSGTLPKGLTFNGTTGAIAGTPTVAGTTPLTFKVVDSNSPAQTLSTSLTLVINPALSISTTSLPGGTYGVPYSGTVTAVGGIGPYTWSHTGTLPTGLTLNATTGTLSGTPLKAGNLTISFVVTDHSTPKAQKITKGVRLALAKSPQSITFTTTPPQSPPIGSTYAVNATASSGLKVAVTADPTSHGSCTYSGATKLVKFVKAGTCVIDGKQTGSPDYLAAPEQQQVIAVP